MAPLAVDASARDSGPANIPPPHLYPVKEAHFESSPSPQPDGYRKASGQGAGKVAIVIDNGTL
jgi:actin-related protein 5